jgi:glyoxylase-like metal-dependent hydrolase (beta-lactamase superfamily II)
MAEGITRIMLSNFWARRIGFGASCYLVDDILIDTGFANAGQVLSSFLTGKKIAAIYCTHNHEDHSGNCGRLSREHSCPVYMSNPDKAWEEGVARLLPYRRIGWGPPDAYQPLEMPDVIQTSRRELEAIPTPGHSQTHTVFFDPATKILFVGDLYVTAFATAVMAYENPYVSIQSLRRLAGIGATIMLNGHGLKVGDVDRRLREKADRVEEAANQVIRLHSQGLSHSKILRTVFPDGRLWDWFLTKLTNGEFSRSNFVKACIKHSA